MSQIAQHVHRIELPHLRVVHPHDIETSHARWLLHEVHDESLPGVQLQQIGHIGRYHHLVTFVLLILWLLREATSHQEWKEIVERIRKLYPLEDASLHLLLRLNDASLDSERLYSAYPLHLPERR